MVLDIWSFVLWLLAIKTEKVKKKLLKLTISCQKKPFCLVKRVKKLEDRKLGGDRKVKE